MTDPNIEELETDLIDSISSDNLMQLSGDVYEAILDATIEEGIIKDIPIVGTLYKLFKVGLSVREKFLYKKILKYLFEIKETTQAERTKFIQDLNKDSEYGQKIGETILYLLDQFDHIGKSVILAQLTKSKINGDINALQFLRLAAIVQKSFFPDLKRLAHYGSKNIYQANTDSIALSLISLGLIESTIVWTDEDQENKNLTALGFELLEYGIKI